MRHRCLDGTSLSLKYVAPNTICVVKHGVPVTADCGKCFLAGGLYTDMGSCGNCAMKEFVFVKGEPGVWMTGTVCGKQLFVGPLRLLTA